MWRESQWFVYTKDHNATPLQEKTRGLKWFQPATLYFFSHNPRTYLSNLTRVHEQSYVIKLPTRWEL